MYCQMARHCAKDRVTGTRKCLIFMAKAHRKVNHFRRLQYTPVENTVGAQSSKQSAPKGSSIELSVYLEGWPDFAKQRTEKCTVDKGNRML